LPGQRRDDGGSAAGAAPFRVDARRPAQPTRVQAPANVVALREEDRMASLRLLADDGAAKEYGIGPTITIGRLHDNAIVIDRPAVSSHHACVFRDGAAFVLEDLQSTNGTFVNDRRVSRCRLKHDDVIVVGGEKLTFNERSDGPVADAHPPTAEERASETVLMDRDSHQRLMTIVMNAEARADGDGAAGAPLGRLRVLHGSTDLAEYPLESHTSLIGKAEWSLIRLNGWLTPNVALAITRNRHGYVATRLGGKVAVNGLPIGGRHDLKDGDVVSVGGLTLEFSLADGAVAAAQLKDSAAA
jgi:pSer/pThr/pTyr-binding forkhead associated (FHA) protein